MNKSGLLNKVPYENIEENMLYGLKLDEDQIAFKNAILNPEKLIVFADAKSGTGKTLIATACADLLYKYNRYEGILYIASPVQEIKQGYLAGSIEDKSIPYFEPFYEALDELGINRNTSIINGNIMNQKNGTGYIECITHTFTRGMNFHNKVIIIDEAQNYYFDELKKVLTRIHDDSKTIVLGHQGQCDLYKNPEHSGFIPYLKHYEGQERAQVCTLNVNHRGWVSSYADSLAIGSY